jgi:hypothetical protein
LTSMPLSSMPLISMAMISMPLSSMPLTSMPMTTWHCHACHCQACHCMLPMALNMRPLTCSPCFGATFMPLRGQEKSTFYPKSSDPYQVTMNYIWPDLKKKIPYPKSKTGESESYHRKE